MQLRVEEREDCAVGQAECGEVTGGRIISLGKWSEVAFFLCWQGFKGNYGAVVVCCVAPFQTKAMHV